MIGMMIGGLLWFGLTLVAMYVTPAALANFAEKRTLGAGFEIETLASRTGREDLRHRLG